MFSHILGINLSFYLYKALNLLLCYFLYRKIIQENHVVSQNGNNVQKFS